MTYQDARQKGWRARLVIEKVSRPIRRGSKVYRVSMYWTRAGDWAEVQSRQTHHVGLRRTLIGAWRMFWGVRREPPPLPEVV